MNILISSVSKKIPLIHALRKSAPSATLIGTDRNPAVIGRYFVDRFEKFSGLENEKSEQFIKECQKNSIQAVVPTRNGELSFFAHHSDHFTNAGIHCMVSNEHGIHTCLDKLLFYKKLAPDFPVITSSSALDFKASSYVVKERQGAGSLGIGLNLSELEALNFAKQLKEPLFQPFIAGQEYSIDLYINRAGKVMGCIARKRNLVVDGESQITQSVNYPKLEELCSGMAQKLQLYGHVVFQALVDPQGHTHVIECNPRFGGASTLSLAMGLRSFEWFLAEVEGKDLKQLPFQRSSRELTQVRYPADYIFP